GRLIDVEQRFAGLSGGRLTFYNSGCLSPGEWTLTPVFHSDEPETPVWHGDWSPYYREEVVTSGLEPVTDADFTFLPVETEPPTIEIAHSPVQPGGTDVITFNVSIEDDHMIQKVEIYEWGRYADGRQTEPELIASYFWDSGFPRERSYRFERGPYPLGEPNEVYYEVAAWDYPGNHAVTVDRVRVRQIEMPGLVLLLGTALPYLPDSYYVASIGEIVFSKDSDGSPPEGEMHCSAHATMTRTDGGTREFVQDYPYYNYVEALCDDGHPMCQPWVPVLAVPAGELSGYGGYTLATGVYEGDGWLERFLRGLIDAFVACVMVIIDAILCVVDVITASEDLTGCEDLTCDVLDIINVVGLGTGGEEDDYMGTAAFMTTRERGFGLEDGASAADFYSYGAADSDEIDWAGALADGSDTEGFCGARSSIELVPVLEQGVTTFVDDDPGSGWIRVLNHVALYDARPVGGIKVKFVGAHVHSDRDGFWRGDGDVYARTLVGAVGGSPVGANDHSLEGEDLAVLPYSAADVHRFECGDVSSGSSFERNRFVFDRSFSGAGIALLYVQIGLWDDDGGSFADNEIGVLSR
ncbi:hypothetical protein KAW64_15845, partial [bacterium]|nr:hypothetical protein [bacterium]